MNSFLQEMLYKYLPLTQHIGTFMWILWDEYNGADEGHSDAGTRRYKLLFYRSWKNEGGEGGWIGGYHFPV